MRQRLLVTTRLVIIAMAALGHLLPSQRPAADGRSAFESGKSSPPGRIWQLAAQLLRCDLTNTYAKGSYRQRISHFTEELSFLSESDKDWVMGRAIVQRLKWT